MRCALSIVLALACGTTASAQVVGSDTIDRDLFDASAGLSLIYRGTTQPLAGDGLVADQFSLYSKRAGGVWWTTPMLLEVTGSDQYTIVSIGTSRGVTGPSGVQMFDFGAIAGSAVLEAGKTYTFGFYTGALAADGTGGVSAVAGTANVGTIPFTGYNDFSDEWSYSILGGTPNVGSVYGTGGAPLDSQGFAGRIYSANLSFIPAPASMALVGLGGLMAARRRR